MGSEMCIRDSITSTYIASIRGPPAHAPLLLMLVSQAVLQDLRRPSFQGAIAGSGKMLQQLCA